ncbi:MAG: ankyrin repeat domain-containing protein [Nitrospinota bacterium]|nr:ankyrin repeat domain-containing protein [Nitrospinota bacterium]
MNPIFDAIEAGDAKKLEKALGVDKSQLEMVSDEHEGLTPLLLACQNSNLEIVRVLLKAGANPDYDGHHYACPIHEGAHNLGILKELLAAGAKPDRPAEDYVTALMMLAESDKFLPQVEELLKAGADPAIVNKMGETALSIAEEFGALKVATAIREKMK